jgi:hypothetical protein
MLGRATAVTHTLSRNAAAPPVFLPSQMLRVTSVLVLLLLLVAPAVAEARPVELGSEPPAPAASCPESCQAVGRVTGFQVTMGERRNPYRVRRRGKIVAFTIHLGKPREDQVRFFTDLFGGPPRAKVTVLRPGTKRRHRLTGHSALFELGPYLGSAPTFALRRPLTMRPGYVVGLTVPTWAPAFGVGLGEGEAWRSSRDGDRCDDVNQAAAQQRLGSLRTYGCLYRTARLLYSVTFVPDPARTDKAAAEAPAPAPAP